MATTPPEDTGNSIGNPGGGGNNNNATQLPDGDFTVKVGNSWFQARRSGGTEEYSDGQGGWTPDVREASALATVDNSKPMQIHDSTTGAVYLYDPKTGKQSTVVAPDSNKVDQEAAKSRLTSTDVLLRQAQLAKASAQAATDPAKAQATIDNLQSNVRYRDARTQQLLDTMGLSKDKLAAQIKNLGTSADLADARARKLADPIWSEFEGGLANLQEMRDKGTITPEQYEQNKQDLYDTATRKARGLISQQKDLIPYADSHAAEASKLYGTAASGVFDAMTKYGVGNSGMFKGAMDDILGGASGFQDKMGGSLNLPSGFLGSAADSSGQTSSPTNPTMTYDPNTDNTHPTGSVWNGVGWNPTGTSGMIPGTAATPVPQTTNDGGFLGGAASDPTTKVLMQVFNEAKATGEDPNEIAQSYLDKLKAGAGAGA